MWQRRQNFILAAPFSALTIVYGEQEQRKRLTAFVRVSPTIGRKVRENDSSEAACRTITERSFLHERGNRHGMCKFVEVSEAGFAMGRLPRKYASSDDEIKGSPVIPGGRSQ